MKHSRRYQTVKKEIPQNKLFSLTEGLQFLINHNKEKIKIFKVDFTLHWLNQKITLKNKIILPNPLPAKGRVVIVKDDLPSDINKELAKSKQVELLTGEELHQRTIASNGKVKKSSQWGFAKLLAHPNSEIALKPLEKLLAPKGIYPNRRNGYLTENILIEVEKFRQGEQEIKTDKGGNIHAVIGNSDFNQNQLEENYKILHKQVISLRPHNWKGDFLVNITLSTAMGPGIKIQL